MKKIALLTIAVLLVVASVFAFAACKTVEDAEVLSFDSLPESVYVVGDDISNFAISIRKGDEMKILEYVKNRNDIQIEGFDTTTEGTREAKITYAGQTITFTYTVKAATIEVSPFAGGAGTEANPYVIKTEEQLLALNTVDTEGKYYELGADITISAKLKAGYVINAPFQGTLSGGTAQYKIIVRKEANDTTDLYIFKKLEGATIKNIKLDFNANALVTLAFCACDTVRIDNVDTYGKLYFNANNSVLLITYNFDMNEDYSVGSKGAKTTIINCDNYADITSTSYIGVFVGFANLSSFNVGSNAGYATFKNCTNNGTITASNVGICICNATEGYMYNVTAENVTNNGYIGYTSYAGIVAGINYNNLDASHKETEVLVTNCKNGDNGKIQPFATMTAKINADKTIQFTTTADIKSVKVVAGYYGNLISGGTQYVQGIETIETASASTYVAENIKAIAVKPVESENIGNLKYINGYDWEIETIDGVEYYIHNNGVTGKSTLDAIKAGSKLQIFVFGFNADGEIIASTKVQ